MLSNFEILFGKKEHIDFHLAKELENMGCLILDNQLKSTPKRIKKHEKLIKELENQINHVIKKYNGDYNDLTNQSIESMVPKFGNFPKTIFDSYDVYYTFLKTLNMLKDLDIFLRKFSKQTQIKIDLESYDTIEQLSFSKKLERIICLWLFCNEQEKIESDITLILNQIDCHLDDDQLDSLINTLKPFKVNVSIFSHSRKNFDFFYRLHQTEIFKVYYVTSKNRSKVEINDIELKDIDADCEHGFVKTISGILLKRRLEEHEKGIKYAFKTNLVKVAGKENKLLDLNWKNVKKFSVITGKNGTGKTALLNSIRFLNENSRLIDLYNSRPDEKVNVVNIFQSWVIEEMQSYNYYEKTKNYLDQIRRKDSVYSDGHLLRRFIIFEKLNKLQIFEISSFDALLTFTLYVSDVSDINKHLANKKFKYKIEILKINNSDKIHDIDIDLNVLFRDLHINQNNSSFEEIKHFNLTFGERIILFVYLWEYCVNENIFIHLKTKCILLDEPDSHLHPSVMKEMIEFIENKLVKEMNFQVIITTHHPVTASFVKGENLFLLYKNEQDKLEIKNALQCAIHPIDHLSDNLFYIIDSKKSVFVENQIQKLFLELINKRLGLLALKHRKESYKLFRNSQLNFKVFKAGINNYKNTEQEPVRLQKRIEETIENLNNLKNEQNFEVKKKDYKYFLNLFRKVIKNTFSNSYNLDKINKFVIFIEHELKFSQTYENTELIDLAIDSFLNKLNLFKEELKVISENIDDETIKSIIRKDLISFVQTGNLFLQSNSHSFSIGFVNENDENNPMSSEYMIYESRRIENYLFDPLNLFLVIDSYRGTNEQIKNTFFKQLKTEKNYQNILDRLIDEIKAIRKNMDFGDFVEYKNYFLNSNDNQIELELKYKNSFIKLENELIAISHDLFCNNKGACHFKKNQTNKDNLPEKCIFDVLKRVYKENEIELKNESEYPFSQNEEYTLGLLKLIELSDSNFMIAFDVIHRFQFMEIYIKHKYTKSSSFHEMFKSMDRFEKDDKIIVELKQKTKIAEEKENYIKEIMKYFEIKEFDNIIKLFLPNLDYKTPLHLLLINGKLDAFILIYKALEKEIKEFESKLEKKENSNELNIILAEFYFNFNNERIEKENLSEYKNLLSNASINTKKTLYEKTDEYKSSFKSCYERFMNILELLSVQIREKLKKFYHFDVDEEY